MLKETIPKFSHVAVLWNPEYPGLALAFKESQAAAGALGLQLQSLEVRDPEDFESAFKAAADRHTGALYVPTSQFFNRHRAKLAELAVKSRLSAIYSDREYVEAGGLMSYGANLADLYRRAATYVDKILKGAKPADLPVEQPTKFEFIINLKAAKQIGLTIPPNVLARADRVIRSTWQSVESYKEKLWCIAFEAFGFSVEVSEKKNPCDRAPTCHSVLVHALDDMFLDYSTMIEVRSRKRLAANLGEVERWSIEAPCGNRRRAAHRKDLQEVASWTGSTSCGTSVGTVEAEEVL